MKVKPKNIDKFINKFRATSSSNESNLKNQNNDNISESPKINKIENNIISQQSPNLRQVKVDNLKNSNENYDNNTQSPIDFWDDINNPNYKISNKRSQNNHNKNSNKNSNFQNFNFSKSPNDKSDDFLLSRYKKILSETENQPHLSQENTNYNNKELYSQNITSDFPTYRKQKKYYNNSVDNNKNMLSVWNRNKKWLDNKKKKLDRAVNNQIKMENKMLNGSFEPKLNKYKSSEDIKKVYSKKENVEEKPENWRYFIRCYQGRREKEYILDFFNKNYSNDVFLKKSHYSKKNNCTNISQSTMNKFKQYLYNDLRESE